MPEDLRAIFSKHLPCHRVARRTAWALDFDGVFALEKFVQAFTPTSEDGQDSFDGATAVKAEGACLKEIDFLGLGDFCDILFGEAFEPFEIGIGLCGDEDEVFIIEPEGTSRALLGLSVVL